MASQSAMNVKLDMNCPIVQKASIIVQLSNDQHLTDQQKKCDEMVTKGYVTSGTQWYGDEAASNYSCIAVIEEELTSGQAMLKCEEKVLLTVYKILV